MIRSIRDVYRWEVELKNGKVIKNTDKYNKDDVVRISFIPNVKLFPRHDIIVDGFKFVRRFGRGFLRQDNVVKEYLHCAVTDRFRLYVKSSNGQCLITPKNYEYNI